MITKRILNNGNWIIGIKPYSNNEKDGYLDIVLAYLPTNKITPYVTWIYNHSDKGFHEGHYHKLINNAIPEFLERGYFKFDSKYIKGNDAIECHYVCLVADNTWDQCESDQAQMVCVYLHTPNVGITSFTDHYDGLDAMRIVRYLSNKYELPIVYQPQDVHSMRYNKLQPIN